MSTTILCAVDVSNTGRDQNVIKQAARLATLDGAQLDVITVMPDYGMSMVGGFFEKDHQTQALAKTKAELNAMVEEALGAETNTKVRHLVAMGNAYEEILKAAEADGADLIVIGAHKPDFKDFLLGPNAARVVRHSTCSVYVVR
ncbi:Universal stress protein family 3 [hydrothermal vent metagenome]|uniref:Universal stress protein family 3 n=1 Tax=hydrothermal vent metagenome TaxID=652676 RepID=A0A3B0SE82_9ZZZZ